MWKVTSCSLAPGVCLKGFEAPRSELSRDSTAPAWETTRETEGNSSAKEGFPATVEGKEELKQVARRALGEEEPLCGVHTTGIVCWPLALTAVPGSAELPPLGHQRLLPAFTVRLSSLPHPLFSSATPSRKRRNDGDLVITESWNNLGWKGP